MHTISLFSSFPNNSGSSSSVETSEKTDGDELTCRVGMVATGDINAELISLNYE
jgi:hypothetical protein